MAKHKKMVDISNVPAGQQKLIKGIVKKSGGGPHMVGSKEKDTPGNFAEYHHMKMMGSPLYYGNKPDMYGGKDKPDMYGGGGKPDMYGGAGKPAGGPFVGGSYKATDTNKEVFSEKKEEKKEEGSKKSEGTKRLSAARSRRKEARKNLKADRLNRRADRMEARRR